MSSEIYCADDDQLCQTRRSILAKDEQTEAAMARRFVRQHGENVRWCEPWKTWLTWDGRRWAKDQTLAAESMAKQTAALLWPEISDLLRELDTAACRPLLSYYKLANSAKGIANMLRLAKSQPGIAIMPGHLDAHPWLWNCANGTIDLRTGELRRHSRADLLTKICPHPYLCGAEGECPIWEQTLDKIFGGRDGLITFVRRSLGSAMSGEVVDHVLFVWWGNGSNGKSLIIETILAAMGEDYAGKAVSQLLVASKNDRHLCEKVALFGKRFVAAVETNEGRRLDEATVKEITGGDTITARGMFENLWSFEPSHTTFLATNHQPEIRGDDDGIWRRMGLTPFTQRFWDADKGEIGPPELQANKNLKN